MKSRHPKKSEKPSLDRNVETVYKREGDLLVKACHLRVRKANLGFGGPKDIGSFLEENELNIKSDVNPSTSLIHDRIQKLLAY